MGTLEDTADLVERFEVKPPSTIVVGGVVNVLLGGELRWRRQWNGWEVGDEKGGELLA